MAAMNWNRPRGGYESEPWRNTRITKMQLPKPKSNKKRLGDHATHPAVVIGPKGPHAGGLYCTQCKKLICWLTSAEYKSYKGTKNGKV